MIKYIVVFLIMLSVLTSCAGSVKKVTNLFRPMPWLLDHYPEGASEPF